MTTALTTPAPTAVRASLMDQLDQRIFDALYRRSLVYNACWEDPAVDRQALALGPDDTMLVITSAGCNVLDYALKGPRRIHAVDANPRQNALLELKLAGIRRLRHDDFFRVFGAGAHPRFPALYQTDLRPELSDAARRFWDTRVNWFADDRRGFYYHGLSGFVARAIGQYLRMRPRLAGHVHALFACRSLEEQRLIYAAHVRDELWTPALRWLLSRQITMSLLGVPWPQRREVQAQHARGVAGFIQDAIEYIVHELPMSENYFYSVYLRGHYTRTCCPEYLKPQGFAALRDGLADRISVHTDTVTGFLQRSDEPISRFVLLDHMDWMSSYRPDLLIEEWDAIFARATPGARVLFRSAHARPGYLERIVSGARELRLRERLRFDDPLAARLQRQDRVHTYAGFHVADLPA